MRLVTAVNGRDSLYKAVYHVEMNEVGGVQTHRGFYSMGFKSGFCKIINRCV